MLFFVTFYRCKINKIFTHFYLISFFHAPICRIHIGKSHVHEIKFPTDFADGTDVANQQ